MANNFPGIPQIPGLRGELDSKADRSELDGKADFVRLLSNPTNEDTSHGYVLSGSLLDDNGNPLATPVTLTNVALNVWENNGSTLLISDNKWLLTHETFVWESQESSSTLPEDCSFVPVGLNDGIPTLTFTPAASKTTGQFALVNDGANSPAWWKNSGTDDAPDWNLLAEEPDLSSYVTESELASTVDSLNNGIEATYATKSELSDYAPLASPALTGNPTAPTQAVGNNSTRLATTAFVAAGYIPLATSINRRVPVRNGTTGAITDSPVAVDASGNVTGVSNLTASGRIQVGSSGPILRNQSDQLQLRNAADNADYGFNCLAARFSNRVTLNENQYSGGLCAAVNVGSAQAYGIAAFPNCWDLTDTFLSRQSAGVWRMGTTSSNELGSLALANLTASGTLRSGPFTVASLPLASTSARAWTWVTNSSVDRTSATIGNVVAGGGSFTVPVLCNGTDWRIA